MGVETASSDDVSARRPEFGFPRPRGERSREKQRSAQGGADLFRKTVRFEVFRLDDNRSAGASDVCSEFRGEVKHVFDVDDVGDVVENHLFVGQHCRGDHRQNGVFVAADRHLSVNPGGTFYDHALHAEPQRTGW